MQGMQGSEQLSTSCVVSASPGPCGPAPGAAFAICCFTTARAASTAFDVVGVVCLVTAKSSAVEASATQATTARALCVGARAGGAVSCCSSSSAGSILYGVLGSPFVSRAGGVPRRTGETPTWMEAAGPRALPRWLRAGGRRPPARPPRSRAPEALRGPQTRAARRHHPISTTPRPAPRRRGSLHVRRPPQRSGDAKVKVSFLASAPGRRLGQQRVLRTVRAADAPGQHRAPINQ